VAPSSRCSPLSRFTWRAGRLGDRAAPMARHIRLAALLAALSLAACGNEEPEPSPEAVEPEADSPLLQEDPRPDYRFTTECGLPSPEEILDDPVVQWAIRDRLRESFVVRHLPFREEGAWIYQCRTQSPASDEVQYYLDVAPVTEPERHTQLGIRMLAERYFPHMPGRRQCRTVGIFHSHLTPAQTGPSGADERNYTGREIPSFVVTPTERPPGTYEPYRQVPGHAIHVYGGWGNAGRSSLSWTCDVGACTFPTDDGALPEISDACGCVWVATVTGSAVGRRAVGYGGNARYVNSFAPPLDIDAVVQDGDPQPAAPWLRISLDDLASVRAQDGGTGDVTEIQLAIPGVQPGETGSWQRVWGTLRSGGKWYPGNAAYLRRDVVGLPEGTGIGYVLTTNVGLTRHDEERVQGWFDARFLDLSEIPEAERRPLGVGTHRFPAAEIQATGEFSVRFGGSCGMERTTRALQP